MNDIEQLCDQCATQGVEAVLPSLDAREDIEALAQACLARAQQAKEQGDQSTSDRLIGAAQYLNYLLLPYD